jgi:hypothetical protein
MADEYKLSYTAEQIDERLGKAGNAVLYTEQKLTDEQQAQARANIGAITKDDIPVYTVNATKTGDAVTVTPVKDTTMSVVTKIDESYSEFADHSAGSRYITLGHFRSKNLFNFVEVFGGVGHHEDTDGAGVSVTINADGTMVAKGTNNTGDYVTLVSYRDDRILGNIYMFPAGTYTLSPSMSIGTMVSLVQWQSGGIKSGTFTMDGPFMVYRAWISTNAVDIDKTFQMWMVAGSVPPTDFVYDGTIYKAMFTNDPSPGVFDWQTGELRSTDGTLIETIAGFEPFQAYEGANTFLSASGESAVKYKKVLDGDDVNAGGGTSPGSGSSEAFDPTVWGLPVLYLNGSTAGMSKDTAVTMNYVYEGRTGTCTVKWQGSSSVSYPKKNYTVKFDNAFEAAAGWGVQSKYCLKANYIDHSHSRNVVNAKLWGQVLDNRKWSVHNQLRSAPNYGAVDGFPIIIVLNDDFHGLYTFNIPKDGWMMGMGSGTNEAIVCADQWGDATYFKAPANLSDDFELEYVSDEANAGWVTTSLNRLINACINSDGTDLDTTIAQYVDLQSAIDYYIFTVLIMGYDMTGKNYLLSTFDGTKWYFGAYDMDSTHGIDWHGKEYHPADYIPTFESFAASHRLFELIKTHKADTVKARYAALRNTVLSESNIAVMFGNFAGKIPSPVYMQEAKKWPMIPNTSTNNISQIRDYYRMRVALADKWIEEL